MESIEALGLEIRLEISGHLYNIFVSNTSKQASHPPQHVLFEQRL